MRLLFLMIALLLVACTTTDNQDELSDSEQIYETLSTSPEFKDRTILLCIDKDCLSIDRGKIKKGKNRKISK